MAISGFVKPLKDKHGNYIFPETSSEAVYCPDGKTIEDKFSDINSRLDRVNDIETIGYLKLKYKYGAKLDGSDDTLAFQNALNDGNIIIERRFNISLGKLQIPNNRILDFGNSNITMTNNILFSYGIYENGSYSGFGEIKNISNIICKYENSIVIDCIRTIFQRFYNIKMTQIINNCTMFNMRNTFNITYENCYCGYYNTDRSTESYGIKIICIDDEYLTNGTENNTNSIIKNCLLQNMKNALYVDPTKSIKGSIDTLTIDNIGFSNCETAITFLGGQNANHIIQVSNTRVENSDLAINNNVMLTISNCYLCNNKIGLKNNTDGRAILTGGIKILSNGTSSIVGINNNGVLRMETADITYNDNVTFNLNTHSRPWYPVIEVNDSKDFTKFISPIYNRTIRQTVAFNFSDLPTTNVMNGTELKIYSWSVIKPQLPNGKYYNSIGKGILHIIYLDGDWKILGSFVQTDTE